MAEEEPGVPDVVCASSSCWLILEIWIEQQGSSISTRHIYSSTQAHFRDSLPPTLDNGSLYGYMLPRCSIRLYQVQCDPVLKERGLVVAQPGSLSSRQPGLIEKKQQKVSPV